MACDPTIVTKLDELLAAIRGFDDPRRAGDQWKQVFKLLQKSGLTTVRVNNIAAGRDAARLADAIEQLRASDEQNAAAAANRPNADTCREAFHAFRKRLNLTRLDDESRLGHSPLSKGEGSSINAITPPVEWPQEVWNELVRQGRLEHIGHGLYSIPQAYRES